MSVFYRKYQNKNPHGSSYGKWFARAVTIGKTVNVDELARHMSEHNTPYSKGAIKGVLTDMIGCIRELMLEGKAVKLDGLAIFSAGIKTKKKGAPTSEDFSTTKHIDSVYMRARATGEFTRAELTKAGSVTELPKNYTDYHEDDDEPQNPSGGNGSSQNGGSQNGGSQSGSGDSGSESGSGDSGQSQQSTYGLTITRSGSGTSTVKDDSENVITGQQSFASGTNLNIEIVPAEGQTPTATINGSSIELTENDGTYTGSFQMPAQASVLDINSGTSGGDSGDGIDKD
jgi:predicted histone-like DNA-binding protein